MSWPTELRGHEPVCVAAPIDPDREGSRELASCHGAGAALAQWGPPPPSPAAPMKPPMHAVACFVTPDPDKREELLQTLHSLAEVIRGEPGCLVCSVCLEESATLIILVSGWGSDIDLRRHLLSEHFRVLSGASRLLGAAAEVSLLSSHPAIDSALAVSN